MPQIPVTQIVNLAKAHGPKVAKIATPFLTAAVAKKGSAPTDQIGDALKARLPGNRLRDQVQRAKLMATEALTDQDQPDRQDTARRWLQQSKAYEAVLKNSEVMPRSSRRDRRKEVEAGVGTLLDEMSETTMKWAVIGTS